MSKQEKIIDRFLRKPKDFTYDEVKKLLSGFGYTEKQGSGPRIVFRNAELQRSIKLHKPHPDKIIKRYLLVLIEDELRAQQLLE